MYNHLFKTDYDLNSGFSQARLAEEKAFAKKCFDAGKIFILQDYISYIGHKPDFEEFYSQFESVSKNV